MEDLRIACE